MCLSKLTKDNQARCKDKTFGMAKMLDKDKTLGNKPASKAIAKEVAVEAAAEVVDVDEGEETKS
jgi:hypothetical protein